MTLYGWDDQKLRVYTNIGYGRDGYGQGGVKTPTGEFILKNRTKDEGHGNFWNALHVRMPNGAIVSGMPNLEVHGPSKFYDNGQPTDANTTVEGPWTAACLALKREQIDELVRSSVDGKTKLVVLEPRGPILTARTKASPGNATGGAPTASSGRSFTPI